MAAVPRSLQLVPGVVESRVVTTRQVVPNSSVRDWHPFRRVAESTASRGRTLPAHAHEEEDVLTYVLEGFASYQLESGATELLPRGAARLLTARSRVSHRVSPAPGGAIRWFSLVLGLPREPAGPPRLQSAPEGASWSNVDDTEVLSLVGPRGAMSSPSGLECAVVSFPRESTTIPRIGVDRRAVLYAISGRGAVDEQSIEAGEGALIEGYPGVSIRGWAGFLAVLASAPRPAP